MVFLPELVPMARDYRIELLTYYQQVGRKMLESRQGGLNVWDNFMENSNYREIMETRDKLTDEAARLLQEIANGRVFS